MARQRWLAVPVLVLALAGCTDEGSTGVATVGGTPSAGSSSGPATDPLERERQFITCMRGQGIDMTDPIPGDNSGRSALIYEIDVKGQGSNPKFQAALDACASLLPPGQKPEPPAPDRLAQLRAFSQCMRDNGVPDFPDPDPSGVIGFWIRGDDPAQVKATEKCRNLLPPDPSPSAGGGTRG